MNSIESLRSRLAAMEGGALKSAASVSGVLQASGFSGGLPRGALIQVTGSARTHWVAELAAQNQAVRVAWIESEFTVFPTALAQIKFALERCLFLKPEPELLGWTVTTLVQSQIFGLIVASDYEVTLKDQRRLQLLCERAGASVLLLAESASASWAIPIQIQADARGARILKAKGGAVRGV